MRRLVLFGALSLLTACNLAPRYGRPLPEMPCSWRVESDEESTSANIRWWESLDDPILNELVLTALENNKDLQIAVWRVFEFYGNYQVVRSALFPQVGFEATALKDRFSTAYAFIPGLKPINPEYIYDFTFSYEIDLWGQLRNATYAAFEELMAQIENRRTVVLTLVSAVAEAYVYLRQLDMELIVANNTLESRKESLRLAKIRFEGGLTSEIEVTQAAAAYEETLANVVNLNTYIPQQENLISVLIGQSPTCILRGKGVDQFKLPAQIPAGLPSDLLIQRPDIVQAEDLLKAANAEIGVARANFFPQITLTGLWGGESFELKHLFSGAARTWQFAANLLQPVFTGGALTGELNVADAKMMEAVYNYQQVILTAFQEVDDALIAHSQARELIQVEERRVADVKEYLRLAWLRYYNGQTDYLTVLDAERQLYRSELDLADAQGNLFLTLIDVYKALGGGWVIDADGCLRPQQC